MSLRTAPLSSIALATAAATGAGLASSPALAGGPFQQPFTLRASIGPNGEQTFNGVDDPSISYDGRLVLFTVYDDSLFGPSEAARGFYSTRLVVKDMQTGAVELIAGLFEFDGLTYEPDSSSSFVISGDGRWVYFSAYDTINYRYRIFSYDRQTQTLASSVARMDGQGSDYWMHDLHTSYDGRFLAFATFEGMLVPEDGNTVVDSFLYDRVAGTITMVSVADGAGPPDGYSFEPSVTNDGRFVAFLSYATNIVPGDTNFYSDVFVRDTALGQTTRISVGPGGAEVYGFSESPRIARDGRYVVFTSNAFGLADPFTAARGGSGGSYRLYVHDLETGLNERIPTDDAAPFGVYGGLISDDGNAVAFLGDSGFAPSSREHPEGERGCCGGDLYTHYRAAGVTVRSSSTLSGGPAYPYDYDLSGDGRWLAWESYESDIVPGDTNGDEDVFVSTPCLEPAITQQPLPETEPLGSHAIFAVRVAGPASYQWRKEGVPLEDDGRISGAGTPVLIINPVEKGDAGDYDVLLLTPCQDQVKSATVSLTIGDCAPFCEGDANNDGIVNFTDITTVLLFWLTTCR